jgi:hypothetical protein
MQGLVKAVVDSFIKEPSPEPLELTALDRSTKRDRTRKRAEKPVQGSTTTATPGDEVLDEEGGSSGDAD